MGEEFVRIMSAIALQHLWQSIFIGATVILITQIYSAMSHEVRSWLWLSAFILAVLMPFAVFLPAQDSGLMKNSFIHETFSNGAGAGSELAHAAESNPLFFWIFIIWMAGTMVQLMRFFRSALHTRTIIKDAGELPASLLRSSLNLQDHIPLYSSRHIASPIVTGCLRQIVLLPEHMLTELDTDTLNRILHHEYAHIHRHDIRIMIAQKILSALYWWNPVLHVMARKLSQCREMACDERAVLSCGNVQNYARSLLFSAEHILLAKKSPLMVGIFHSRKNLIQRIERLKIMNIKTLKQNTMTSFFWSISIICLAATTAYMVTPRLAQADQSVAAGEYERNLLPILKKTPEYPELAEQQKLEGYVVVKFDVGKDGTTSNHIVLESSHDIFNEATITSARTFVYKPHPEGKIITGVLHKITYELGEKAQK